MTSVTETVAGPAGPLFSDETERPMAGANRSTDEVLNAAPHVDFLLARE